MSSITKLAERNAAIMAVRGRHQNVTVAAVPRLCQVSVICSMIAARYRRATASWGPVWGRAGRVAVGVARGLRHVQPLVTRSASTRAKVVHRGFTDGRS